MSLRVPGVSWVSSGGSQRVPECPWRSLGVPEGPWGVPVGSLRVPGGSWVSLGVPGVSPVPPPGSQTPFPGRGPPIRGGLRVELTLGAVTAVLPEGEGSPSPAHQRLWAELCEGHAHPAWEKVLPFPHLRCGHAPSVSPPHLGVPKSPSVSPPPSVSPNLRPCPQKWSRVFVSFYFHFCPFCPQIPPETPPPKWSEICPKFCPISPLPRLCPPGPSPTLTTPLPLFNSAPTPPHL